MLNDVPMYKLSRSSLRVLFVVLTVALCFGRLTGSTCFAAEAYLPLGCMTQADISLATLANNHRAAHGLPRLTISKSLNTVAQWHVADSKYAMDNNRFQANSSCNLHSWIGIPNAPYGSCCYYPDHRNASCIWDKPRELTSYTGHGFELAAHGFSTVERAMTGFINSSSHNDVLLNRGAWANYPFKSIGVGVDLNRQVFYIWLGQETDPEGRGEPCDGAPSLTIQPEGNQH